MKLYYDMLVPYMPDAIRTDAGEFVGDPQKAAGRQAMIKLAEFQQTGELSCLYHAVIDACTYANVDLVDTILNIPEDLCIPDGITLNQILDDAAKTLFMSIKPDSEFDINLFVCNVLNAAHAIILSQQINATTEPTEPDMPSEDAPTE